MEKNPLSANTLTNIFRTSPSDPYRIINRESKTIEFKESYSHASMAQYFKTMASFANNEGGYIIFGVTDSPRKLVGLKADKLHQFESIKVEEFTKNLYDYFSPEIKWEHCTFEFKSMSFGVIYTEALTNKPCMCKKAYEDKNPKYTLREGDIFYRYSGRSERIKYTELQNILESTRKNEERMWIDFLQRATKVGIENACLLDVENGSLTGFGGSILIDENILSKIAFIREGEFVEKKGKPALRLIGNVEEINTGKVVVSGNSKRVVKAIEPENIVRAFLKDEAVSEPLEYIKRICTATTANYPVYFLISQMKSTISDVIDVVNETTTRAKAKDSLIDRLNGKTVKVGKLSDAATTASSTKRKYYNALIAENVVIKHEELRYLIGAILTLSNDQLRSHEKYLKAILIQIFEESYENAASNLAGDIRKAICRIDEALYMQR